MRRVFQHFHRVLDALLCGLLRRASVPVTTTMPPGFKTRQASTSTCAGDDDMRCRSIGTNTTSKLPDSIGQTARVALRGNPTLPIPSAPHAARFCSSARTDESIAATKPASRGKHAGQLPFAAADFKHGLSTRKLRHVRRHGKHLFVGISRTAFASGRAFLPAAARGFPEAVRPSFDAALPSASPSRDEAACRPAHGVLHAALPAAWALAYAASARTAPPSPERAAFRERVLRSSLRGAQAGSAAVGGTSCPTRSIGAVRCAEKEARRRSPSVPS